MAKENEKFTDEITRGTIKFSDLRPANLHPKAKARMLMGLMGTFLVIFGCIYMLSMSVFYFNPDLSTPEGLNQLFTNLVAFGYVIGSILVIIILWYVMIKDCPISPAAKLNYNASHDKSSRGVKVVATIAAAIANKGTGDTIESVATAIDDYFSEGEKDGEHSEYSSNEYGASV